MPTYKLILEYDGTEFVGWQSQKNGRAVQDVLETALRQISQEEVRVAGAGRTDAGVHALGQVASFTLGKTWEPGQLRKSLNGVLPQDVVAASVEPAADDFNARHDAVRRRYKYYIMTEPTAIWRRYCWWMHHKLDHEVMQRCAAQIVGEIDFQSFSKVDTDVDHFRCTVSEAVWRLKGGTLEFDISANRFLYGMVRALVGTMVEIGRGHRKEDEFPAILSAKNRGVAGMSAPSHGLFFRQVFYK